MPTTQVQHRLPLNLTLRAAAVARVHTVLALAAFGSALVLGCLFHYKKIVKNGVAGYPHEWFPSVSATIGDWYPERSVFQILIAVNSGPRFALVALQYFLQRSTSSWFPAFLLVTGLLRTLSCGGWVYITSTDDHDAHDVLMITYIVCNVPWMLGGIACTPKEFSQQRRRRILFSSLFFGSMVPMIYFFIQHKVHRIPGAYTRYSFFEWGLIILDVLYDSVAELTFSEARLEVTINANGATELPGKDSSGIDAKAQNLSPLENRFPTTQQEKSVTEKKPAAPKGPPLDRRASTTRTFVDAFHNHRDLFSFASDMYLAFLFWTIFTSLIPTLFYFSVWELGIAGAELALLSVLSPALLGVEPFRAWASTKPGRVTLHVLTLAGLVAYKFPTPAQRLVFVTIASFFLCIEVVVAWSNPSTVTSQSIYLGLGLILSSLAKHANHSNNPLWPMVDEGTSGYNKTGILLAILSIVEFASRSNHDQKETRERKSKAKDSPRMETTAEFWVPNSLALGSLLFSLHCFLSDPSTLIAWTWTGYPIKGPVPHLHGSITHVAQAVGILVPLLASCSVLTSPVWFFCGAVFAFVLYSYKDWLGYSGGLGFAIFLMSIIPQILKRVAGTTFIGRKYFTAFFVAVLLYLANVWTVAYAFVPGGDLLRERSDLVFLAQILLLVPAFTWSTKQKETMPSFNVTPHLKLYSFAAVSIMTILSGLVTLYRMPANPPQPYRTGQRIIRAGIWTVHFGMDNEGRDSQRLMKELIRDMELDVVGLLETDLHRPVYGNRDLTRVMAEEIGFYVDLGPGPNQHTWGAVLLSKFPIINSTHHLLPSPHGELAPAISAFLDVFGTEVLAVVAHNGQEEDPLDRELQSTELARIMKSTYPAPAIFLGYVVTKPHAPRPSPYQILVEDGKMHDIDAEDRDRWCEYILYRGLYRTSYLRMSRGRVTDTELQAGQFVVPPFGRSVVDESWEARYLRIHKETLDIPHWFPMEYYGDERHGGKNGHFYHVFGTPLYYNLPEGAL